MLIGYARVSKTDGSQSLDLQRDALRAEGIDAVNVYHDFASGVRDDRPGLDSCLRALRKGDVLVVWKLDRLGRNLAHLVNTVQDLSARGVGLRVLAGQGAQIDTTTAAGRLVFRDRYKVAKCIQAEPVFCGFGRSAHSKVIFVSVLSVYFRTNRVGTLSHAAQPAERASACSSTIRVADSCLSGG